MTSPLPDAIPHRPRLPFAALVGLLAAPALALAQRPDATRAAVVGALVLAGAAWAARGMRRRRLTLREDGVHDPALGGVVPYASLSFLRYTGRALVDDEGTGARYLFVGHATGVWRVPRTPGLDRVRLYRALLERSGLLAPPDEVPLALRETLERERADFGPERVLVTGPRPACEGELPRLRWPLAAALALLLAMLLDALLGAPQARTSTLGAFAMTLGLLALIVAAVEAAGRKNLAALRAGAHLIVSPRLLALTTAREAGTLRWTEVRGLSVRHRRSPVAGGLALRLDGATFLLGDHYACPLTEIASVVRAHVQAG